jgi:hypothetical protein
MKILQVLLAIIIGLLLWTGIGATLEAYDVHSGYFMIAGFWLYPTYDWILNKLLPWANKDEIEVTTYEP